MTDRIDLDERADPSTEPAERERRGDWLWRPAEDDEPPSDDAGTGGEPAGDRPGPSDPVDGSGSMPTSSDPDAGDGRQPVPHVPRPNEDKPVGIPVEGGGADGGPPQPGAGASSGAGPAGADGGESPPSSAGRAGTGEGGADGAAGPHGGGADDMTMALTYEAATRLEDPAAAVAEATRWADWLGLVGDVDAHVINKFQRDHRVDVDFFNGSGAGPGERLAAIDAHSMFFADRMVVVGVEGRDEPIAEAADWEFVPLATAAEKAGWALATSAE